AVRLGRHAVGVELALGVDQHDLLERIDRLENRIEGGVAEADQLVGAGALHARQPLTQRRLPQRQGLAVLEVVIRLLRPAERSVALRTVWARPRTGARAMSRETRTPGRALTASPAAARSVCVRSSSCPPAQLL